MLQNRIRFLYYKHDQPTCVLVDTPTLRAVDLGRREADGSDRWLIRGLSLDLSPGESVALEGPTGAGKTLLLRSLAALDPLDEGDLELLGRPLAEWNAPQWRRRAVYLHQAPQLPAGSVEAAVCEPLDYRVHEDRGLEPETARGLVERLGRDQSFLEQETEDLSGGERQVAALARALVVRPQVLLLDEATAAMDTGTTERVEALLREWLEADAESRALLWVTHDAGQADRVAHRRLRLIDGRIVE